MHATSTTSLRVPVRLPGAAYEVTIGSDLLGGVGAQLDALLGGSLAGGKTRVFVVTSPEIARLWAEPLLAGFAHRPTVLEIPAGEAQKRLPTLDRLAEALAEHGADRDTLLIALGGGVLGDLTGFLAAIYMRGIRFVQVPTTMLAQVDSSVGGKTGVNLAAGKNLVGAFHHPIAVFADVSTLATLPPAELRAGLQEAIKSAIIRDPALFEFLEGEQQRILAGDPEALQRVVADSVRIKAAIVEADEREGGLRMILNLGHTLGHAIEAATGYTVLLHGEAVAWGMLAALAIAERRGTVRADDAGRVERLIDAYGALRPFHADPERLVALTARDKKNRGGTRSFVLPVGIGDAVVVTDVSHAELLNAAAALCHEAARR